MRGVPITDRSSGDCEAAHLSYMVGAGPLFAIEGQLAPLRLCDVEHLKCIALLCHVNPWQRLLLVGLQFSARMLRCSSHARTSESNNAK